MITMLFLQICLHFYDTAVELLLFLNWQVGISAILPDRLKLLLPKVWAAVPINLKLMVG